MTCGYLCRAARWGAGLAGVFNPFMPTFHPRTLMLSRSVVAFSFYRPFASSRQISLQAPPTMTRLMHSIVVGLSLAASLVTAYVGTNSRNLVSKGRPTSPKA